MDVVASDELERISRDIAAERGLADAERAQLVGEYLDFLQRAAASAAEVQPTMAIDEIWHRHILSTESYLDDCSRWFGAFIHHRPSADSAAGGTAISLADCSAPSPAPPCNGMRAPLR